MCVLLADRAARDAKKGLDPGFAFLQLVFFFIQVHIVVSAFLFFSNECWTMVASFSTKGPMIIGLFDFSLNSCKLFFLNIFSTF